MLTYSIGQMQIESILGEIYWYSSDTNLLSAEKKIEYAKDLVYGGPSRNFLAPAINFVIVMAQTPSSNIALLGERSLRELYQIPPSADGCRDMKLLLDWKLIQVWGSLGSW